MGLVSTLCAISNAASAGWTGAKVLLPLLHIHTVPGLDAALVQEVIDSGTADYLQGYRTTMVSWPVLSL